MLLSGAIFSKPLTWAFILYICIMSIFLIIKPSFMYDHDNKEYKKTFEETQFPIWLLCIVIGILSYSLSCICFMFFVSSQKNNQNLQIIPQQATIPPRTSIPQTSMPQQEVNSFHQQQHFLPQIPLQNTSTVQSQHSNILSSYPQHVSKIPDSKLWQAAMK